jgi:transcriptional regulator with XRE-family HTH domain
MSQTEFATQLGMKQTSVSTFEKFGGTVTDPTVKALCMAFNLNEDWLRYGTKPMYIQEPTFSLDKFVKDHGGTDLELEAMKAYFELEPDIRKMLVNHFKERLTAVRDEPAEPTMTVEEAEAAYIKSRSNHVQKTVQSALNTSADTAESESKVFKASNQ